MRVSLQDETPLRGAADIFNAYATLSRFDSHLSGDLVDNFQRAVTRGCHQLVHLMPPHQIHPNLG